IDSATIRRDFSYFGELGKKGYGYNIDSLLHFFKNEISENDEIKIAIVGVENLGKALLTYNFSIHDEMTITEAFDIREDVIGTQIGNVVVSPFSKITYVLKQEQIDVVILTTPENAAQQVADTLVEAGIKGILNFTPTRVYTPSDV